MKGNTMKIYAVSEPYESPCEYFATEESAEAFVALSDEYWAEYHVWEHSKSSDRFVPSDRFDASQYYPKRAAVEEWHVRP